MRLQDFYWRERPALPFCHSSRCASGGQPGRFTYADRVHERVDAQAYGYTPGYSGPLGPLGVLTAPITAPVAMLSGGAASGAPCGVTQDFNGRYTALCGL